MKFKSSERTKFNITRKLNESRTGRAFNNEKKLSTNGYKIDLIDSMGQGHKH